MAQSEDLVTMTVPEEELWENLKISNDFMFAKVMRNPELCRGVLERLLEITIDHMEYPEEQKVIDIAKFSIRKAVLAKRILKFIEGNALEDDFTKKLAAEVQKIKVYNFGEGIPSDSIVICGI